MLCPVCLDRITVSDGLVLKHADGVGKVCPMSGREPFTWAEWSTRDAVANRSGWRCEWCGVTATECHHRKPRSQGGLWEPQNILHLCGACHHYYTEHPDRAYETGVSLHRNDDPEQVPVCAPTGVLWLTNDVCPPFPAWAR